MHSDKMGDVLWHQLEPQLDRALAQLREADRQAILLRFFANQSFQEVATTLHLGEDAAKKRVARALEKLRHLLSLDGKTLTTAALGALLSSRAVQSAPAGVEAGVTRAALSSTAISISVTEFLPKGARNLYWEQFKTTVGAAALGLAILGALVLFCQGLGTGTSRPATITKRVAQREIAPPSRRDSLPVNGDTNERKTAQRQLVLCVVDELEGKPLMGVHVKATFYGPKYDGAEEWTDRVGKCSLAFPKKPFEGMNVWVFAPGHVGKVVGWQRSEELSLPIEYTVKLQRGRTSQRSGSG